MKQESVNFIEFMKRFQTEEQCREFLFSLRWPEGFVCPCCGSRHFCEVKKRRVYHCLDCGHQASVTANTIFHRSHTPLNKWFLAVFLMAQDKRGLSAAKLTRDIEVSPPTAWLMLQKIRKAMSDRDASYLLSRIVEIDDAYFGAPDEGGKRGRGTDKTPGVIAVQVDERGRPEYVKLMVVENLRSKTLVEAAQKAVKPNTEVRTDGYKAYHRLSEHGYTVVSKKFAPERDPDHLLWLHKSVSNLKAFIAGTFHGLDSKHLQRYFDEFAYRFNRRKFQAELFSRLLKACISTNTITYRQLVSNT